MKHRTLIMTVCLILSVAAFKPISTTAQEAQTDACTSIMVGKKASLDGSVITSHHCDGTYRTWMGIVPAKDYKNDTTTAIYDGLMHTEHSADGTGVRKMGEIPQVKHTYKYLNTAYPCLNEHQLAIGETTYTGRKEMINKNGLFHVEELARIALERCTTAREAIRLMGELVKQYGYCDSGECLTIADKNEVWIFEIQGEGPDKIGGVWAAQRIPDDEIAVSANVSRIGRINIADTDHFMASENVFEVAKKMKLWNGKEEFSFWKAYSGGNYYNEPKNYSVRELFIMQQLAPSRGFTNDMQELPVSVRPDSPVSVEKVSQLLASYYEATPLSISCKIDSIAANCGFKAKPMITNPWMRPDEIALYGAILKDSTIQNIRTVSVSWCSYSTVIQLRSWLPDEIGGVAWVSLDNPGLSPRFPIFSGNTALPMLLSICGQFRLREDSALWHFRHANELATVRWGNYRKNIKDAQQYFLDKGNREMPFVESTWKSINNKSEATQFLDGYVRDFFGAEIMRWEELYKQFSKSQAKGF